MPSNDVRNALELRLGRIQGAGLRDPAAVCAACAEVTDWPELFECARRHELLCALHDVLRRNAVELAPELDATVRREAFMLGAGEQPMRGQVFELLDALGGAGVRAVALKGPLLAERIYPSASLRQSADLDVLVARDDLDRSIAALGTLGYFDGESEATRHFVWRQHYQLIMLHPDRAKMVELHFRALRAFGASLDAEDLLERAIAYEAHDGRTFRVLAPDDELLYLAVHAAKHFRLHLKWLYDIALFVRSHADLDVDRVVARAREAGVERGFVHVLDAVETYFGVTMARGREALVATRASSVAALRALDERVGHDGPLSTLLAITHGAVLADTAGRSASVLRQNLARVARRRAYRYLPWLVPNDWSG
jgi:hypothetical protein